MDFGSIIITLIILLFSVVLHELSHGVVADRLGDHTARLAGRLTLNPLPHLDLFGSILLPFMMWFATQGKFTFGMAKPVPVNFLNLRNPKRDMVLVSLAGPGANIFLVLAFAIPLRLGLIDMNTYPGAILLYAVWINLLLAIFNLLPIPPLDGSKVLAGLLSDEAMYKLLAWERYGFVLIIGLLFLGVLNFIMGLIFVPTIELFSGIDFSKVLDILEHFRLIG